MKSFGFIAVIIFVAINVSFAQNNSNSTSKKQVKWEAYTTAKLLVKSGRYEFTGVRMYPQQGGSIDLISRVAYLRVDSSFSEAILPFFGKAYDLAYSSNTGGIEFNGEMTDYTVEENEKKMKITISFNIKTDSDFFQCYITMSQTSNVSLSVNSNKRSPASYTGYLRELPETK